MKPYIVGKWYTLPVIETGKKYPMPHGETITITPWMGYTGILPILTEAGKDEPFISADVGDRCHIHIDWRFMRDSDLQQFALAFGIQQDYLWARVMIIPEEKYSQYITPVPTRLKCLNDGVNPVFTDHYEVGDVPWRRELETKYLCSALVNGRCPHRGTPEQAMIKDKKGRLVCPAHGLKFDAKTKNVVPGWYKVKQ